MFTGKRAKKAALVMLAGLFIAAMVVAPAAAQLLLDDSLQGSTSGTRSGGTFANGGWQVTGTEDWIFWHLPYSVTRGAAEFYVKGITDTFPNKTEQFHMYDYTFGDADYNYGGYRDNPCKHFIRKSGVNDGAKNGSFEVIFRTSLGEIDQDTAVLSWNPSINYKMRVEWAPEGGNTRLKVFRDGGEILNNAMVGTYAPVGHSVRIAKCRGMGEGAEIGATYSYMKVWDMTNNIPAAPTVTTPSNGETMKSSLAFIKWTGDSHDRYHVHVCTADNPDSGLVWDSGEVMSARDWAWTGALGNLTNYYVYV